MADAATPAPPGVPQPGQTPEVQKLIDPAAIAPPGSKTFTVCFYIGEKANVFVFTCANAISATFAALFIAMKSWPTVHTVGVWEGEGDKATTLVCYVPITGAMSMVGPKLNAASPSGPVIPAAQVMPGGKGFDDLMKDMRKRNIRGAPIPPGPQPLPGAAPPA